MKHQKGEMVCFNLQSYQAAEQSVDSGNGGEREGAGTQLSLAGYEGTETTQKWKSQRGWENPINCCPFGAAPLAVVATRRWRLDCS